MAVVHEGHMTLLPPSMAMVWPQTNEASSDARKAMTLATSSTLPTRPSGWLLWPRARYPFTALPDIPARAKTSVPSMTPGLTLFTLMPDAKGQAYFRAFVCFFVSFSFHFLQGGGATILGSRERHPPLSTPPPCIHVCSACTKISLPLGANSTAEHRVSWSIPALDIL